MQRGFSMLEMLLVIAIIASVLLFSLNRYYYYQRISEAAILQSRILLLQQKLEQYFHNAGCYNDGHFSGNFNPALSVVVGEAKEQFLSSATVSRYTVEIKDSGRINKQKLPIYYLSIKVDFNPTVSLKKIQWYSVRLKANFLLGRQLVLQNMIGQKTLERSNSLWIMSSSRDTFRLREQQRSKEKTLSTYSYCAH